MNLLKSSLVFFAASAIAIACSASSVEPTSSTDGGGRSTNPTTTGQDASTDVGTTKAPSCTDAYPTAAMPLISKTAKGYASSGDPTGANAGKPDSSWYATSLPAWYAYDLSAAPADERGNVLLSWYSIHAGCYIDTSQTSDNGRPTAYTIEINDAPGGTLPTTNWKQVVSSPNNIYCGAQHWFNMNGANWVRMSVTQGTSANAVNFELDVQSAPACASDSWLFMGDSITYETFTHAFCDLPQLVNTDKPAYWPAVLNAALGGTNTGTATLVINDTMKDFPGRFVVLAYGTNDHPNGFQMEALVQKVIAAGKIPVVPHMPWAAQDPQLTEGPMINAQIDALYVKYPQIVKGPDLWKLFEGTTTLINPGDVHPTSAGQEALRKAYAATMETLYQ